jgi:hypothetical protein
MTDTTYKSDFFAEFEKFKTTWDQDRWADVDPEKHTSGVKSWWRVGNALHTAIEGMAAAQQKWGDGAHHIIVTVRQMLDEARDFFFRRYGQSDVWVDDYGWWGIAFVAVYENFEIFKNVQGATAADECLQFADDCWQQMRDKAWDTGGSRYPIPITGGCWNNKQHGSQNTVTNALYLTLSIRLYSVAKTLTTDPTWIQRTPQYLDAACAQFKWFGDWYLKGANRSNDVGLFNWEDATPAEMWVLERPTNGHSDGSFDGDSSVFNGGDPDPQGLPMPFDDDNRKQYWTGDQGVLIAGLIGLLKENAAVSTNASIQALDRELKGRPTPSAYELAKFLALGMVKSATGSLTCDGVLHEAPQSPGFLSNYYVDYAVGKGVLMRYLAFARKSLPSNSFDDMISTTAQSIRNHPPDETNVPPNNTNMRGLIWDDKLDYKITAAGTNERDFDAGLDPSVVDPYWAFSIRMARVDGLAAGIPLST